MKKTILLLTVISTVGGCSTQKEAGTHDATLAKLEHATRDIQRQWGVTNRLSTLARKDDSDEPTLDMEKLDDPLGRVITFPGGYQGELGQLIEELAAESGYRYIKPAGRSPIRGIPVTFGEEFRTIGEYVYDAGIQAGSRATVVLDMKAKQMQITYTGY